MSDDHCERSLAVNIVWNNNNKCLFSALVGASPPPEQHMSKHLNTRESRFTFILKLEEFLSRKTSHASTMSCDQWGRAAAAKWPIRNEHCQWRHLLTRQEIRDLVSWPEPEPGATYTLATYTLSEGLQVMVTSWCDGACFYLWRGHPHLDTMSSFSSSFSTQAIMVSVSDILVD